MFIVYIEDAEIDLLPGQVSFHLNSPLFNSLGSHSLSFYAKDNEKNRIIFKFPSRLTGVEKPTKEFHCRIRINSWNLHGRCLITQTVKGKYRINFMSDVAPLLEELKNTKLKDLPFQTYNLGSTTNSVLLAMNIFKNGSYPSPFTFPSLWNKGAYGEANEQFLGYINYSKNGNYVANEGSNDFAISAQPYLLHVIEKVFEFLEYSVDGSALNNSFLKKILMYSNHLQDRKETRYLGIMRNGRTQTIQDHSIATVQFDTEVEDDDNCLSLSTNEYVAGKDGLHWFHFSCNVLDASANSAVIIKNQRNGFVIATGAFDGIGEFELTGVDQLLEGDEIYVQVQNVHNHDSVDLVNNRLEGKNLTECNLNRYQGIINLKNNMPDMNLQDFLNILPSLGVIVDWDHRFYKATLIHLNDIFQTTPKVLDGNVEDGVIQDIQIHEGWTFDITCNNDELFKREELPEDANFLGDYDSIADFPNSASLDSYLCCTANNSLYIYHTVEKDGVTEVKWEKFSDKYYKHIRGNGGTSKTYKWGVIGNDWKDNKLQPCLDAKGTSSVFPTGKNEPGLKLMLYHGNQPEVNGVSNYPYASYLGLSPTGTELMDEDLTLGGDRGVVTKQQDEFLKLQEDGRPLQIKKEFKSFELAKMDFVNLWELQHRQYLIKSINFRITTEGEITLSDVKVQG